MFSKKKEYTLNWPFFVVVIFGSVVLVLGTLFGLVRFRDNADDIKTGIENAVQVTTPAAVEESYIRSIERLRAYIEEDHTAEEMLGRVEEVLFGIRVPSDRRDVHLQMALDVDRLKGQELSEDALRDRLVELLRNIQ